MQVALDEAAADGYTQVAQYEALYNSTTATAEEIAAAVPELKQEVVNWKSSAATPSQPVDFTTMIENSSFDNGNNGWDVVGSIGHQAGTTYETADNRYKMDHSLRNGSHQVIMEICPTINGYFPDVGKTCLQVNIV